MLLLHASAAGAGPAPWSTSRPTARSSCSGASAADRRHAGQATRAGESDGLSRRHGLRPGRGHPAVPDRQASHRGRGRAGTPPNRPGRRRKRWRRFARRRRRSPSGSSGPGARARRAARGRPGRRRPPRARRNATRARLAGIERETRAGAGEKRGAARARGVRRAALGRGRHRGRPGRRGGLSAGPRRSRDSASRSCSTGAPR